MNAKRTTAQHVRALLVSIAICFLFIPSSYSSIYGVTQIRVQGDWPSTAVDRSLPTHPITAYLIDNYIQIMNESPDCDITVSIINSATGDIVYQQTVPEAATPNMMISVTDLTSGEYILELTGPNTRHLEGSFIK